MRRKIRAPFLGTTKFFYCPQCHSPLLTSKCCLCANQPIEFYVSPPGDLYLALNSHYNFIEMGVRKTIEISIPRNFIYLLNKVPTQGKTADEVYFLNKRLGVLFFDPQLGFSFKFDAFGLKFFLAFLLSKNKWELEKVKKMIKYVIVDVNAKDKISRGANVLAPGITEMSNFTKEDYVLVLHEDKVIALGKAKVNSDEVGEKGIVLKNVFSTHISLKDLKVTMNEIENIQHVIKKLAKNIEEFSPSFLFLEKYDPWKYIPQDAVDHIKVIIAANKCIIERHARKAITFIEKNLKDGALVSFSGGKDSICVLDLTIRSGIPFRTIFLDTGIEFPETTLYAKKVLEKLGGEFIRKRRMNTIIVKENKNAIIIRREEFVFWKVAKHIGFPAKDFRWCTRVCKFVPFMIAKKALKLNINKMVVGVRRYESFLRSRQKFIEYNKWTRTFNFHPIRNWSALHVWLYIFYRKLPVNPLYKHGFHRLGCWLCPSNELVEIHILEKLHPELFAKLEEFFVEVLPEKWKKRVKEIIRSGVWRTVKESAEIIPRPGKELLG